MNLILRTEKPPRIGERVVDELLRPVGRVFDVFGPSSSPYVAVKPRVKNPDRLIDRVLYTPPKPKGRRK